MKRKLAAILFADVAGYSRMMAADEQATTLAVKAVFSDVVAPIFSKFCGRIIRISGDGIFAEFESPVNSVSCAIALQEAMAEHNKSEPTQRQIHFRIGINYGDVIIDEEDEDQNLYGTDVNIAARLEQTADVGGIWVSERVFTSVRNHPGIKFRALGTRRLKNIPGRVPIFGVLWGDQHETRQVAGYEPALFRSITPTIAIMPFRVPGGKDEDRYLSEAIVEDVMIELGRFTEIGVISSGAISFCRDTPEIKDIGRRLSVDFLVTGSIARKAETLRVSAALFETETGEQLWANRYEWAVRDIFALQDTIARDLASQLPLRIENVGLERSRKKPIESLDAYDCYIRGRALYRLKTVAADKEALQLFERANTLDPEFADPYAIAGAIRGISWTYSSWGIDPLEDIMAGRNLIKKALSLNQNLPRAHGHLGWTFLSTEQFDEALRCFDKAISLNPNDTDVLLLRAYALIYMGEPLESIRICQALIDLNPNYPAWYKDALAGAQFIAEDYVNSLQSMEEVADMFPESMGWLAACQAHVGLRRQAMESAHKFISRVRSVWRGPSSAGPEEYVQWFLYKASPFKVAQDRANLAAGLRKAGLPVPESAHVSRERRAEALSQT
jgi:adenylate cyclase